MHIRKIMLLGLSLGATHALDRESCEQEILAHTGTIARGKSFLRVLYTHHNHSWQTAHLNRHTPAMESVYHWGFTPIENARAIIWALYGIAGNDLKKGFFTEGTFVVEDKDHRLFNFLRSVPGAYKRISSHFKDYKTQHYGLDIPNLPCLKQHILFGQTAQGYMFIKPENHGIGTLGDALMHGQEFVVAQARKQPYLRSLLGLTSDDETPGFRKERIQQDILRTYNLLLQRLEPDRGTVQLLTDQAKRFGLLKIISTLKEYIKDYRPLAPSFANIAQEDLSASTHAVTYEDIDVQGDLLRETVDFINALTELDNITNRTGNEIIITQAELHRALRSPMHTHMSDVD